MYFQLLGMGFALILSGFVLFLIALTSAVGGYAWLGITDGWVFASMGAAAMALGIASIKVQLKLTPN